MKKVLFLSVTIFFGFICKSQTIGFQTGANLSSMRLESPETSETKTLKSDFGFIVGIVSEIPFGKSVYFRPELNYIQKKSKLSESGEYLGYSYTESFSMELNYIELPLNFIYKYKVGSGTLIMGAGPTIGLGLSGKANDIISIPSESYSEAYSFTIKFDGKKDAADENLHLKAINLGANINAGYQLTRGAFINLSYNIGLTNLAPDPNNGKAKINSFAIKLGYILPTKK